MERVEAALPGPCELALGGTAVVTQPTVLTIGHSTRTLDAFIEMLRVHGVKHLVDVRTIPRSRHNPQLNRDTLPEALRFAGIAYTHRGTAPRGPARLRASPDRRQTRETGTAPCFPSGFTVTDLPK